MNSGSNNKDLTKNIVNIFYFKMDSFMMNIVLIIGNYPLFPLDAIVKSDSDCRRALDTIVKSDSAPQRSFCVIVKSASAIQRFFDPIREFYSAFKYSFNTKITFNISIESK